MVTKLAYSTALSLAFMFGNPAVADPSAVAIDSVWMEAPIATDPDKRVYLHKIPAPRGRILDRQGRVLANSRASAAIGVNLPALLDANAEEFGQYDSARVMMELEKAVAILNEDFEAITMPAEEIVAKHWRNRPLLPLWIATDQTRDSFDQEQLPAWVEVISIYRRTYPQGEVAAHLVGYVSRETPRLAGEFVRQEWLWPDSKGRAGLEKEYEKSLRGKAGLLSVIRDANGRKLEERIIRPPEAGMDLVTTLNLAMQRLAKQAFDEAGRRGAVAMMDASNGDLLALHSSPSFDPNQFVPSISAEEYRALTKAPSDPMHPRAFGAVYPPGSTFKPITALAALESGAISPYTQFSGSTYITIDGRRFHNWNDESEGMLNVKGALKRSTNTWFYRAGLRAGRKPIQEVAEAFGIGQPLGLRLEGGAPGVLADRRMVPQGIANLSIGQGETLVTPLHVAWEMSTFANETFRVQPRLVSQLQTTDGQVVATFPVEKKPLFYRPKHINAVKKGLYQVVNAGGTGSKVRLDEPIVYGKTGTAQWSAGGVQKNAYWFAGFVRADEPRMAFSVLVEGEEGEDLYSSQVAAPIAAELTSTIYAAPEQYAVRIPGTDEERSPEPNRKPLDRIAEEEAGNGNRVASVRASRGEREVSSSSSNRSRGSTQSRSAAEPEVRRAVPVSKPKPGIVEGVFKSIFD